MTKREARGNMSTKAFVFEAKYHQMHRFWTLSQTFQKPRLFVCLNELCQIRLIVASNQSMDEVLANLDPSERLSVDLVGCESLEQQADRYLHPYPVIDANLYILSLNRILAALKGDIFYLRWRQLAWQNFKQEG